MSKRTALLILTVVAIAGALSVAPPGPTNAAPDGAAALGPLAEEAGVMLGAAVDVDALGDDSYRSLLATQVNLVSTRNDLSMVVVQPQPGVFDFTRADAVVDFAVANDMAVRGHELIGPEVPDWVRDGEWTADSLTQVMTDHIAAVIGYYAQRNPGVVVQWDVVGEAVLPDGSLRPTIWQQTIGDDHIGLAFEAARSADADATLFYDDFYDDLAVTQDAVAAGVAIVPGANAERTLCEQVPKCVGVRDRITVLLAAGVPVDGIGLQSHLFSPDPLDFARFAAWVEELGLEWAVTEFDVPLPITEIAAPESLSYQATVYADALGACVDAPACDTFVTWGISDRFSPIPFETGGAFGGALWFDQADEPKPAFEAMAGVLTDRAPTPPTTITAEATTTTDPSVAPATTDIIPAVSEPVANATDNNAADSSNTSTVIAVVVGLGALALVAAVIVGVRRRSRRDSPT